MSHAYAWLKKNGLFWLLMIVLFSASRWLFWQFYTSDLVRTQFAADMPALFGKGLLFDIKASSIVAAIPFLLSCLMLCSQRMQAWGQRWLPVLWTLLLTLVVLLTVSNVYFFQIYGHQFDAFVFGIVDEDTQAVLKTIWSDFPVIRIVLALSLTSFLVWKLFNRGTGVSLWKKHQLIVLYVVFVVLLSLGARGSLGTFPLRQDNSSISVSPEVNKLLPNALISLDWARKEYQNSKQFVAVSDEDGKQLLATLLQRDVDSADLQQLLVPTPENHAVEQHSPNVVLAVMESMSTHLLTFDNEQRDLLGSLKPHWQNDWVFPYFVSEGNGTSDSLHRLLIRSPLNNITQSSIKNHTFISNVFTPYKKAGYDIAFISSGNLSWRNFDSFLRHLGVDEIVDENVLKQHYPDMEQATWGVPDQYMFRYAQDRVMQAEKNARPVFIMLLSITNHPPFQTPKHYQRRDFALTPTEHQRLANLGNATEQNEIFNTYRYANDALGMFISAVKPTHTIIAATGDHNIRAIGYPDPQEQALEFAVPFYLYVPEAYRSQAVFDPKRIGSHKDIMPTLYELSLSKVNYYQTGCNLTAADTSHNPWCGYGFNALLLMDHQGIYRLDSKQFYRWSGKPMHTEKQAQTDFDDSHFKRAQNYPAFLTWQINRFATEK